MLIQQTGPDGQPREMEMDITKEEWASYQQGAPTAVAFPNLSSEEILFLQTGLYQEEFDKVSESKQSS